MSHTPSPRVPGQETATTRTLSADLERTGFYPRLVADVVDDALDGAATLAHLVHLETHFERAEVRRHVTVLALTDELLVITHVDEAPLEADPQRMTAQVSTESVPLAQIATVVLSYVFAEPAAYEPGDPVHEVTLAIAWSGGQRLDILPASCGDPNCDADHGYTGTIAQEDIVLRISAEADGPEAVSTAKHFARLLRAANAASASGAAPGPGTPADGLPRPRLAGFGGRVRGHGGRQ
ncbi:DUF5998 family protein [Sinomonas sp. JGH33]|uniref:DUF5998 family protein n=1 Tax=Sinomonas terricola TaxID=3110330 RepID=A0ABU5T3N2_9MICC|nr:DUF5998 family protein [Sinomonas sp. JGH33]MEA5454269.1 DUF5998 family protein [Sinomonas sp. JGH33]